MQYAKAGVSLVAALATAATVVLNGGHVTQQEAEAVVIAFAAVVAVWAVPNKPAAKA